MTRAKLVVETGGEPVEVDLDVTDPDSPVTVVITATDVKVHTKDEPTVRSS